MIQPTIHWLGAGLSSSPGIIRLATAGRELVLWNRTVQRAVDVFSEMEKPATTTARTLTKSAFDLLTASAKMKFFRDGGKLV